MERSPEELKLHDTVLRRLLAGARLEQIAGEIGLDAAALAEKVDLRRLLKTARDARSLQDACEHCALSNARVRATETLAWLLHNEMGGAETQRRVCAAILRGFGGRRHGPSAEAVDQGCRFLETVLAHGSRGAKEVLELAKRHGISRATLYRAKA